MPRTTIVAQFQKFMSGLTERRARLEKELSQISEVIGGMVTGGIGKLRRKRRGRPPQAAKAVGKRGRKRGRRRLGMTAENFILKVVGDAGQLTTAQINGEWKKERGGSAGNTLTKMTKDKKLVKHDNPGGRGSIYKLPAAAVTV